ncbi:GNAT family N-acetyltransferase [Cellulomonas chitinilytica]|uniref:GNAT family N-acetyltransferase n=1 Tax=Cellulomonas chitinilytica TaxID=398759 RepID=UPI003570FC8E
MTLTILSARGVDLTVRRAAAADVPAVVALLERDPVARARGDYEDVVDASAYLRAFDRIDADPAQLLVVADLPDAPVVATMQLTWIPGLARAGATRLQVEAVRVDEEHRSRGIGEALVRWACEEGERQGATLVQLTSDRTRDRAHAFYERLGFVASHVGFKRRLG